MSSALTSLLIAGAAHAQALPTGGSVASGNASIASGANSVTVTQTSDRAIVNWAGFDVGAGNAVIFVQPTAQAATLNRVTGSANSTIAGTITSNGTVYLVNPNGIAITSTGSMQTGGGFVASTLDIADADFNAGKLAFVGGGASKPVSNAGTIAAGSGAYVALLGGSVSNSGTISVPLGKVGLGSGEQVALDLNGDGFMQVAAPSAALGGVDMSGAITATGGRVELKAASVRDAVRNVVNMSGTISVDSATGDGGAILLTGGETIASGTLSARATGKTGNGGTVETSGDGVDLNAVRVATDAANGAAGTWLIDPVDFTVAPSGGNITGATLSSNLASGNVIIRSASGTTGTNGNINVNDTVAWSANTLTLDAYADINVNAVMTASGTAKFAGVTGDTSNNGTSTGGQLNFNLGANGFTGRLDLANTAAGAFKLNGTSYVVVTALGAQGSTTGTDLQGINGALGLNYVLGANIDASATSGWNGGAGFVPIGTDGASNVWNGSTFASDGATGFSGTLLGLGHIVNNVTINRPIVNYVGLFGFSSGTLANVGVLQGSIKGSGSVGGLVGASTGSINTSFTNLPVSGQGNHVGGLAGTAYSGSTVTQSFAMGSVTNSGGETGGLIGFGDGTITQSHASGAVVGTDAVGGLIGWVNFFATRISLSYATGSVTGNTTVGGLVGWLTGTVSTSYATGAVSGTSYAGGLVGHSLSTVTQSYATGAVSASGATGNAGGLVGFNSGTTNYSYATGTVTGVTAVGGLAGYNSGTIVQTYASGAVNGNSSAGGLVGDQEGSNSSTTNSYWDSYSTGESTAIGSNVGGTATSDIAVSSAPGATTSAYAAASYGNFNAAIDLNTANPRGWVYLPTGQTRPLLAFEVPYAVVAGSDSSGNVLITSAHQLQLIDYNAATLAASYALAGNIDLSETGAGGGSVWASTGWVPLGTDGAGNVWNGSAFSSSGTTGFSGSLSGQGFALANLTVTRTTSYDGLFGYLSAGTLANLSLTGGSVSGGNYVGGLVGFVDGARAITAASTSSSVSGSSYVGGLIGYANYEAGAAVAASQSLATGNVTGVNNVGGLVGYLNGQTIAGSHATGSVTAIGSGIHRVGGLVGATNGTSTHGGAISSSYATGAVASADGTTIYAGGLVGYQSSTFDTVTGSYATGSVSTGTASSFLYAGGLIGSQDATLSTSFATGAVAGLSTSRTYVGGLTGYVNDAGATIDQAWASGAVNSAATVGSVNVGGLVGYATGSTITRSYATGPVNTSRTATAYVGGLVGVGSQVTISQAYATGAVTGGSTRGGLIAALTNGAVVGTSYWDSYSTGQTAGYGSNNGSTFTATAVTSDPAQSGAATYAFKTSAYANLTGADWIFFDSQTRPFGAWEAAAPGGTITNAHQLQLIGVGSAATLAGSYTLGGNINLAETGANHGTAATSAGMWATTGFVPIGTDGAGNVWNGSAFNVNGVTGFSGTLDGAGYTIGNLTVARPAALDAGLFGWAIGTLRNIVMTGATVSGRTNVGALAGYFYGGTGGSVSGVTIGGTTSGTTNVGGIIGVQYKATLANSSSSGSVSGTSNVGGAVGYEQSGGISGSSSSASATATQAYAGGLVGYQVNGTVNANVSASGNVSAPNGAGGLSGITVAFVNASDSSTTATITNAAATGTVTGTVSTGGLVGFLGYGASVSQAYASGAVSGTTNVGGLIGYDYSSAVTDSYATGAVVGSNYVGGLVGTLDGATSTVARTYAIGHVTGDAGVGGLIGWAINSPLVTASVWDTQTTGQTSNARVSGATGYTTAQLQDYANYPNLYVGWDFSNIWLPPNQAGQNATAAAHYPRLRSHPTP